MELPKGTIVMWHDKESSKLVPNGWAICNGQNGTPNFVDRFALGTANKQHSGELIGSSSHHHHIQGNTGDLSNGRTVGGGIEAPSVQVMGDDRHAHIHTIDIISEDSLWLPPSTKVVFIMKL